MAEKILWIDDEIDLLKPHILFLENKGYEIEGINNASDGIELIKTNNYSAILLDENMPGIGGIEAISKIKDLKNDLPIIMVTKNEEEQIMEEAIGSQIADYLLKPINPNQVLLALKKNLKSEELVREKNTSAYQQEFRNISMELMNVNDYEEWIALYEKLINWELKLEKVNEESLLELFSSQKKEANNLFSKFVEKNYYDWVDQIGNVPILSHQVFKKWVEPPLKDKQKVLFLVIDNLRLDQWKIIKPLFSKYYKEESEQNYFSILPTATQYARNAIFSGLLPLEIEKKLPQYWLNDVDEGQKNQFEPELLAYQLNQLNLGQIKSKYFKILNSDFEKKILDDFNQYKSYDLLSIVYNFIDILSHAKTDNQIVQELIRDDKTFRSLTQTWFENSSLVKIIEKAAENNFKLVITTDHGTIQVHTPTKVVGDKETSVNIRYKLGRNLAYDSKDVFAIDTPEKYFLPKINLSSKYIFAKDDFYLVYPKNYNQFVQFYKDSYQHGGVSMEEMIVPCTTFS